MVFCAVRICEIRAGGRDSAERRAVMVDCWAKSVVWSVECGLLCAGSRVRVQISKADL